MVDETQEKRRFLEEAADAVSSRDILLERFNIYQRDLSPMISSMGLIFLVLSVSIAAFTAILKHMHERLSSKVLTLLLELKAKLMYNSILRYMLQSFFRISLGTFMNIRLVFLSAVAPTALLFSIPTTLALASFTCFTYVFIQKNKTKLDDKFF